MLSFPDLANVGLGPCDYDPGATATSLEPLGIRQANVILHSGTAVVVDGLTSAPEWNGTRGLIRSFDADKGRYEVLIWVR